MFLIPAPAAPSVIRLCVSSPQTSQIRILHEILPIDHPAKILHLTLGCHKKNPLRLNNGSRPRKKWSIHNRPDIISKYEVLEHVGFGVYSDVYKARRLSNNLVVALNEVHDYQSAFHEIEDLEILQNSPNVVVLHEYLWWEDGNEDVVLILEYLRTDLARVDREAEGDGRGIGIGELKRWMVQILCEVDACHRDGIVHRDLKPSNLLVSNDGVLKIACPNFSSGLAQHTHEAGSRKRNM